MRKQEIGNKVNRKLVEWQGKRGRDGQKRWDGQVDENFVLLTNGTTSNDVRNKERDARPPKITFKNGLCMKMAQMAREGKRMNKMEQSQTRRWRNIHMSFKVKMFIIKGPVSKRRARKQGRTISKICKDAKNQRVRGRSFNMKSKGNIQSVYNDGIRNNRDISIVLGYIHIITMREGISRSYLCARENFPKNIKVFEEERPTNLLAREFMGVFEV